LEKILQCKAELLPVENSQMQIGFSVGVNARNYSEGNLAAFPLGRDKFSSRI